MTTLVVGSTGLASRVEMALAHGDPDGYVRWAELGLGEWPEGTSADPSASVDAVRLALRGRRVRAVVDAHDPFADGISPLLETVCDGLGIAYVRLAPVSFGQLPGSDRWHWVDSLAEAAAVAWRGAGAPLVALEPLRLCADLGEADGRPGVCHRRYGVADGPRPTWLREPQRSVRTTSEAMRLLDDEAATVLVTNDSGDPRVVRWLEVCGQRALEVVMVRRSPRWQGAGGSSTVLHDVEQVLTWRNTAL